jgi:hypothetical protein
MTPMQSRHLICLALLVCLVQTAQSDDQPYTGKVFLGVTSKTIELPASERYESTWGVELTRVAAGSVAEVAGLKVGDVIVSIDGQAWTSDEIRLSRSFGKVGDKARPGEMVAIAFLRQGDAEQYETVDATLTAYPRTRPEPHTPTNAQLRPDLVDHQPDYAALAERLIDHCGLRADTDDLLERLARSELVPDPDRLAIMQYAHRDAFRIEAVARELTADLRNAGASALLDRAATVLTSFGKPIEHLDLPAASYRGADLNGHLDYIAAVLDAASQWRQRAFADVTDDEQSFIVDHRVGMLESFEEYKMLSYDSDYQRQRASLDLLIIAERVDVAALIQQARVASLLVDPAFVASLRDAAEASGMDLSKDVVAERDTPHGKIAIAGTGRQRHQDVHYAALYDLGGDDVYGNNQGASMPGSMPTAVLVDYAGDDAYESTDAFSQACGDMGVGMIVDLAGDDHYIGMRFTQGTGFMGVGLLIDEQGDDVYRGLHEHQGVGHYGVGMLVDRAGDDRYESHLASQGVGLPGGFGALIDESGDDHLYCKGDEQSGYGTAGIFEGWGQGAGIGYRPYASGGVGLVYDGGGRDRIEGGNFTQGGGYFYGLGVLFCDGNDDDRYIGSRYTQGFTAHQAAGIMIEVGGNDIYQTRNFVAQGLAWDEAVTVFIDEAGDDRYEGGSFSHGASAMNGLCVFLERGGRDTYLFTDQALAGGNTYHGGKSLSVFIDQGGDDDQYPSKPNNAIRSGEANFIFIDLPGSIDDALADDAFMSLMPQEE